jgi:Tfp pilus assembly protein PilN
MINLLPSEMKQNYRYARRNRRLLYWAVALVVAITGVAAITAGGLLLMGRSINQNRTDIAAIEARLNTQDIIGTQKEIGTISNNLKLMVTVLSKEVLFSKLLVQLGNTIPANVILTNLSISQTEGAIDITARAVDYNAAAQLQANLADPGNKIFSKADIVNITCSSATGPGENKAAANYPCTTTIKALFASDNPFLFIHTPKAGQ